MHAQPMDDALVGLIMGKLALVYGRRFSQSYEADMVSVRTHWAQELSGLSPEAVHYALSHLPADYCPNVLQFRMLATQRPMEGSRRLAAPPASPEVRQRALAALQGRQEARSQDPPDRLAWATRIVRNPVGKSSYAVRLATQVLQAHGRRA